MSRRNDNAHLHNHKQGEHNQRDLTNTHLNNIKGELEEFTFVGSNLRIEPRAKYYTTDVTLTNNGQEHGLILDNNARLKVNTKTDINTVSASHSLSIAGNSTEETTVIDLGSNTSTHKLQFAGTTSHNNIDVVLKVSNDNITFYDFTEPIFTVANSKISGSTDLTFRYYKLAITDNTGSAITVNLIESGKSL